MRVILSGGGSGGHIYPALAIYNELKSRHPEMQFLYIGTANSLEADIVPREGIPFQVITSRGFKRRFSFDTLRTIAVASSGFLQAGRIIRDYAPDLVIGTGGYVSGPSVLQAALCRIPTMIHEQNALPSLTNRLLARFVKHIALSFPEARDFLPGSANITITGNPTRRSLLQQDHLRAVQELQLDPDKFTVLFVQGSLGSATVNKVICQTLSRILFRGDTQILFVTGHSHFAMVQGIVDEQSLTDATDLHLHAYLYDVGLGLSVADLIVSRAGGMMAEINLLGIPAIYIPSPFVADNHQEYNARAVENYGAAAVIREKELNPETLYEQIAALLDHPESLKSMSSQALSLAKPGAAAALADIAESLMGLNL